MHLLAEIDIQDAEDQQSPADMEAPGTVAEVRVATEGLGVGHGLLTVRAGIGTCFCYDWLLAWRSIPVDQAVAACAGARFRLVAVLSTAFMTL